MSDVDGDPDFDEDHDPIFDDDDLLDLMNPCELCEGEGGWYAPYPENNRGWIKCHRCGGEGWY
jgi:hypothetical protein